MIRCVLTVGIPGSGKSTWARAEIAKDPINWVRINNDDLRAMFNSSIYSADYEKIVIDTRNYLIRDALKRGKNVIVDNLNLNKRHFEDTCKIAKSLNKDIQVYEKVFYVDLEEAIARDAKREGKAQVGEAVIKKWWKESGKEMLKHHHPRVEIFTHQGDRSPVPEQAPPHVEGAPEALICDLDGTLALIHGRSPYDASDCDIKDQPNIPVIETVLAHYNAGRQIIFCSGREDKYRPETIRFIEKHCQVNVPVDVNTTHSGPGLILGDRVIEYRLFMRKTDDFRKDAIIKEEIYRAQIEGKYNVLCVLDDRDQVVNLWRSLGLVCFQVAPGSF